METIKYLRRVNLGNYEHEELEVTTTVKEGEDKAAVTRELIEFVQGQLNLNPSKGEKVEAPKNKNETKGEVKVEKPKPQVKEEKKEAPKEETKAEAPKEEVKTEAPKDEPKAEAPKKEEAKKEAKKETTIKVKPTKATLYDRNHDPHKALLGKFLDAEFPNWRAKDKINKAVEASKAMNGKDFQDGEGNILETFKVEFRKLMA